MDRVISLPIAAASFFVLPDYPENSRVWYLNEGVSTELPICTRELLLIRFTGQGNRQKKDGTRRPTEETAIHEEESAENLELMAPVDSTPSHLVSSALIHHLSIYRRGVLTHRSLAFVSALAAQANPSLRSI